MKKIGLIAGSGQLPIIFAKEVFKKNYKLYIVLYLKEAEPELRNYSVKYTWISLGQVGNLISFFNKHNVNNVVMLGAIKKSKALKNIKLDFKAITIIAKAKTTNDDVLLRTFGKFLKKNKIDIKAPNDFIPELLAKPGIWTKRKPDRSELKDMKIGFEVAKKIGYVDVGQSVIVSKGTVLAVEAIEGTDAVIKRSGRFGIGKSVLVKVSKPNQDMRFDIPSIGLMTIENMNRYGVKVIAIEAEKTLIFDKEMMINIANLYGISIVCF